MAKSGVYDCMDQIAIVNLHLVGGYMVHSDWVTIHFKMI